MRVFAACLLCTTLACYGQERSGNEKKNPLAGQKTAIDAGAQRFKGSCAACHGSDAEGGRGPALAGNRDLQSMSDEQLFNTIRQGIAGTSMPPSQMPDDQTWQLAAFVRNLSSPASEAQLPGNAKAGEELFFGKGGCSSCHAIRGQGGSIGPDLTDIGADLTVHDLRESIAQPSARITPGFDTVAVVLKNGSRIEGVAKDNSNYSIAILDRDSHLHLLNKTEVSEIRFSAHSMMPDGIAEKLGPDGMNGIIAFLAAQSVRPPGFQETKRWRRIH